MPENPPRKYNLKEDEYHLSQRLRSKVKMHPIAYNGEVPVYGVSIPREIALKFLDNMYFTIIQSGLGLVLEPYQNPRDMPIPIVPFRIKRG